jgi:hypothetical protein
MRRITTALAAIALVASGAHAQGNGKGNDKGGGKPAAAAQQGGGQGQGNGRADKGRGQGGDGPSMAQSMRGADNRGNSDQPRGNADRGNGQGNGRSAERAVERVSGNDRGRGNDDRTVVIDRRDGRFDDDRGRGNDRDVDFIRIGTRGLIDGCPPGLAKKRNGCQPPGQDRRDDRWARYDRPDWWGLSGLGDGRYFYRDGYLMRLDGDRIGGFIPLLGGALSIGNAWPSYYEPTRLPGYYESYYGLGPYGGYRYADDVIYRVDPETAAITSIAALLTGDDFAIGQPMPLGYDVYNVPYAYRDDYFDSPNSLYRYSDGYVYEVDPTTRLITAAIELIAS